MAIDGVTALNGVEGGGTSGNVPVELSAPVSLQNGGTGTSVYTNTQLVNYIGAVPTSGGSMSGNLTVGGGILIGPATPGLPEPLTLHIMHNAVLPPPVAGTNAAIHIIGADGEQVSLEYDGFSGSTAPQTAPCSLFMRAARNTAQSPQAHQNNDALGIIGWRGRAPSDYTGPVARIVARPTQNYTDLAQGTRLCFDTTANDTFNDFPTRAYIGSGLVVGDPAGGDKGPGTINAQFGIYINNVAVGTGGAGSNSFTGPVTMDSTLTVGSDLNLTSVSPELHFHRTDITDATGGYWRFQLGSLGNLNMQYNLGAGWLTPLSAHYADNSLYVAGGIVVGADPSESALISPVPHGTLMAFASQPGEVPAFSSNNRQTANWATGGGRWRIFADAGDNFVFHHNTSADGSFGVFDTPLVVTPTSVIANGDISVPSDRRVKQNIEPYSRGLAAIRQLNPIAFQYNGLGGTLNDGRLRIGLDADNVSGVVPEMVGQRRDHMLDGAPLKTISQHVLPLLLLNAIKELADRVDALERSK